MQFVVPGRLCITGEHSDWAASFISSNENIIPGKAVLICTKEMAITTKASLLTDKRLKINHNQLNSVLDVELEDSALLKEAKSGSFWSYAAGVAWVFVNRYKITTGISIDLSSTLPMCKGLSSSAAICVTVAEYSICYFIYHYLHKAKWKSPIQGKELVDHYVDQWIKPLLLAQVQQWCLILMLELSNQQH